MTVNRNAPCPCGSGKKYKKCCLGKTAPRAAAAATAPAATLIAEGTGAFTAGRLAEAERLFRRVLGERPDHPAALAGAGACAARGRDPGAGLSMIRRAIDAAADGADETPETLLALADLLRHENHFEDALRFARRVLRRDGDNAKGLLLVAICGERTNRLDDADAALRRLAAIAPEDDLARMLHATVDRRRGALDTARRRLETLVERPSVDDHLRHQVLTELGHVLDRAGEHDAAFAAYTRAGRIADALPESQVFDRGLLSHRIDRYRAGITDDLLERWSAEPVPDDGPAPVFLVGFPRSGTTLTEQILAAHPRVKTSDERDLVGPLRAQLAGGGIGGEEDVPPALRRLDPARRNELRADYRRRVEAVLGAPPGDALFVDKYPLNLIDMGLLNVVFPDARVIVVLRDPRDVCLSCFMQNFRLNAAMIHFLTLEGTAAFYARVMGLWLHLRPRLRLRFVEVRYEDTVVDLAPPARRILDLLDLDWTDEVRSFHEKARQRQISTPSYSAVIEPVHTRSVARWRRYERQMERVQDGLRPFVEAFGYGDAGPGGADDGRSHG